MRLAFNQVITIVDITVLMVPAKTVPPKYPHRGCGITMLFNSTISYHFFFDGDGFYAKSKS